MSKLAFLQNIQVVADERPRKSGGSRKEWNPTEGLTIRLWKNGEVYPSQELVDQFELEYKNRLSDEEVAAIKAGTMNKPFPGNAFDVADTADFPAFQSPDRLLIINVVPKDTAKVDLFGSVGYKETMEPLMSVMDQGAATFGKDSLIPMIQEIYGIELTEENPFIDLVFVGKNGPEKPEPFRMPAGKTLAFFPKKVARGEKKGTLTVERRENPEIYVLYPKQLLQDEEAPAEEVVQGQDNHVPVTEA